MSNDKSLNTRIQFSLFEGHLTAHYLFKLDPMTVPVMKRITLHNLNLICWKTSNFSIDISSQQIPNARLNRYIKSKKATLNMELKQKRNIKLDILLRKKNFKREGILSKDKDRLF